MSIIFVIHNIQEIFKTIHSIFVNIYQYKVDNVILLNSTLCMPHKNKMLMFNFLILDLKIF